MQQIRFFANQDVKNSSEHAKGHRGTRRSCINNLMHKCSIQHMASTHVVKHHACKARITSLRVFTLHLVYDHLFITYTDTRQFSIQVMIVIK